MTINLYIENKIIEADAVLNEMQDRGFRLTSVVYGAKVVALCKEMKVVEAVEVIEKEMVGVNRVPTMEVALATPVSLAIEDRESTNSTIGFFKFALCTGQELTIVRLSVTISILDVRSSRASTGKEGKKTKLRGVYRETKAKLREEFGGSNALKVLFL
ncbi:hypothetical protein ACLB2K_040966 [Fragaria x ananassa]